MTVEVVVGRIGRPHGVRGELTVEVRTDDPERHFGVGRVLRTDPSAVGPLTVATVRPHQQRLLVGFRGVRDRTLAESLRGVLLVAEADGGPQPGGDEYYDHQLIGLRVVTTDGVESGEVTGVLHGSAQDLLVVGRPGRDDALVPFVRELVPGVDLDTGVVTVADRPGLLDPEQAE